MEIKKQQLIIENTTQQELLMNLTKLIEDRREQKKLIPNILYISDVANQLKKSITHVRRLISKKRIKYLQEKKGAEILFYQEFIDEYLDSLKTKSLEEIQREVTEFVNKPLSHGKCSNR